MLNATQEFRTVADYINLCAEIGHCTSPTGLKYATLSNGKASFKIPSVRPGDVAALTANILDRYSDGILLDPDRQVSLICNWAHANDVDAKALLRSVSLKVVQLGDQASEYQLRTRGNIEVALLRLDRNPEKSDNRN